MYKLLATDLDGTLYHDHSNISKINIETINKAHKQGKKIVLASGRGFLEFPHTRKTLGLLDKEDYTISYNGALITRNSDDEILSESMLDFETAKRLFEFGLKYDCYILVFVFGTVYVYHNSTTKRMLDDETKIKHLTQANIDFLKDEHIPKVCFERTDYEYIKKMAIDLRKEFDNIEISFSAESFVEVNKKGVNKGQALEKVCELLNINLEETIAMGDSTNDLSMINKAGLGVAIKNASKEVKQKAGYITKNDYLNDGVAEVINKFLLEGEKENA